MARSGPSSATRTGQSVCNSTPVADVRHPMGFVSSSDFAASRATTMCLGHKWQFSSNADPITSRIFLLQTGPEAGERIRFAVD